VNALFPPGIAATSLIRRSIMPRTIENLDRASLPISRRIALRIASLFPLAVAFAGPASKTVRAQGYGPTGPKFTQLLRSDLQGQGNQVQESIVTLAEFQPGQASPWHIHPGAQEILYVLEGTVTAEVDGQAGATMKAGELLLIPAETPHLVRNDGASATARAHAAHSRADKEKPLLVAVGR
jgi:quercetin dioxygenase-like cupin family protein